MRKNAVLKVLFVACLFGVSCLLSQCCCKSGCETEMDKSQVVYENIITRKSVRAYDPNKPIEKDVVEKLLKAAMAAPTAVNKQPWEFVVVDDKEIIAEYAKTQKGRVQFANAGILVVICGNMEKALEGEAQEYWVQDASAACENMLLAAHAFGLGAVWTGVYPIQKRVEDVSNFFKLPETIIPLCVVPVGYPAEDPAPKDKWVPEKVHWNKW